MLWTGSYEDLRDCLRRFTNFHGDPAPYDFNGVVGLLLALLDNMRQYALEAELEDVREVFDDQQAAFLLQLADYVKRGGDA